MKLTDKWFWWLWIVTEVIIVFIGFHELGFTKEWISSMVYLGLPQPLMILLIFFKELAPGFADSLYWFLLLLLLFLLG